MMSDWGGGSVQSQCSQKKSERRGWGGKPFYHIHQTHTHTHTHTSLTNRLTEDNRLFMALRPLLTNL